MSKFPDRCQTAAISCLSAMSIHRWKYLCLSLHSGRNYNTQCVPIMKNKPISWHYAGTHKLTAHSPRNRITYRSEFCQNPAVRKGFLTGRWKTIPGMSARTSNFSFSSPMPKPSGFSYSPSFIRRGPGGGTQYSLIRKPAKKRVSIMKNKPICSHYTEGHQLTTNGPKPPHHFARVFAPISYLTRKPLTSAENPQ